MLTHTSIGLGVRYVCANISIQSVNKCARKGVTNIAY